MLNKLQRDTLEHLIVPLLDTLMQAKVTPEQKHELLHCIATGEHLSFSKLSLGEEIKGAYEQLRKIAEHPSPHTRSECSGMLLFPKHVSFRLKDAIPDQFKDTIHLPFALEPEGLLSLTRFDNLHDGVLVSHPLGVEHPDGTRDSLLFRESSQDGITAQDVKNFLNEHIQAYHDRIEAGDSFDESDEEEDPLDALIREQNVNVSPSARNMKLVPIRRIVLAQPQALKRILALSIQDIQARIAPMMNLFVDKHLQLTDYLEFPEHYRAVFLAYYHAQKPEQRLSQSLALFEQLKALLQQERAMSEVEKKLISGQITLERFRYLARKVQGGDALGKLSALPEESVNVMKSFRLVWQARQALFDQRPADALLFIGQLYQLVLTNPESHLPLYKTADGITQGLADGTFSAAMICVTQGVVQLPMRNVLRQSLLMQISQSEVITDRTILSHTSTLNATFNVVKHFHQLLLKNVPLPTNIQQQVTRVLDLPNQSELHVRVKAYLKALKLLYIDGNHRQAAECLKSALTKQLETFIISDSDPDPSHVLRNIMLRFYILMIGHRLNNFSATELVAVLPDVKPFFRALFDKDSLRKTADLFTSVLVCRLTLATQRIIDVLEAVQVNYAELAKLSPLYQQGILYLLNTIEQPAESIPMLCVYRAYEAWVYQQNFDLALTYLTPLSPSLRDLRRIAQQVEGTEVTLSNRLLAQMARANGVTHTSMLTLLQQKTASRISFAWTSGVGRSPTLPPIPGSPEQPVPGLYSPPTTPQFTQSELPVPPNTTPVIRAWPSPFQYPNGHFMNPQPGDPRRISPSSPGQGARRPGPG